MEAQVWNRRETRVTPNHMVGLEKVLQAGGVSPLMRG